MQPIYKIFSDNGMLASRSSLKSVYAEANRYQDGYYATEDAVKAALAEIAHVHRSAGRKAWEYTSPQALPSDCECGDCVGYLLVVDKVDREWRWWAMRIRPNLAFADLDNAEQRFMDS